MIRSSIQQLHRPSNSSGLTGVRWRARTGCLRAAALGAMLFIFSPLNAGAQHSTTGTWNYNGNANWSDTSRWLNLDSGTDYPSGLDAIADLGSFNISANRTLTLDVPVTLGTLIIGDITGSNSYTLAGGTLTFDSSTGFALLDKVDGGANDTISSAIVIATGTQLDITVHDVSNSQGLLLTGVISGGTNGTITMTFEDLSPDSPTNGSLNYLYLSGANTFQGQLVVKSGLLRLETSNAAAGAVGVGNETIILDGGAVDLRDRDLNLQNDNTEIFQIAGMGPNGLGALRNTTGTAVFSHLELTGDALVNSQSTIVMDRHLDGAGTSGVNSVLDFGASNHTLSKIGSGDFIIRGADVLNANGASLNIYEGEVRFESRGTAANIDLDGLTVTMAYNRNPYDNVDFANGSRTSGDPFGANINQAETAGNSLVGARFSMASYWGASVTGAGTLAEQTKETLTFDGMTFNLNNGVFQREGNGEAGRTFDHIFTNVTINLVGGGVGQDATGTGNLFAIDGGSGSYNSTTGTFDHPGVTEFNGSFDNTTGGNAGTGFAVRGSRELRVTGASPNFNGDVLIKLPTYRWITNTFDRGNGGQAATQYYNMSLAGANGSLNQANSITLTRWGSLALFNNSANPVYASANNDDRINDDGFTNFRNGFLMLETDVSTPNTENLGNVVADFGTNYMYLDTRAGGQFDGSFETFTRNNGAVLKIYDANPAHTWGTGVTDDRLALNDATGLVKVGADAPGTTSQNIVVGLFGGVVPTLQTPTISTHTRPLETVQGTYMYNGAGTGLMTLDGGFLRPLTAAEYDTGLNPTAGTNWLINRYIAPVSGVENYGDANNYSGRNVTADTAINSLTVSFDATASGQVLGTSTKDFLIIEQGRALTINSGVINFVNFAEATSANLETVIRGGFLNMNGGAAIINSNAIWHDIDRDTPNWYEVMTGNSSFIRSHIVNVTDFTRTGRDSLYLDTWNDFTGNIYTGDQGALIARHAGALGAGGAGREVVIGGGSAFLMEYGTNISGINLRVSNTAQASITVLRNEGVTHSTWGGDVILDVADATGGSDGQSYTITARNNGTLSVLGNIYTDHTENFANNSDAYADPPVISTSIGETYTLNLRGQFRDTATGNVGTVYPGITSISYRGDNATQLDRNHSLRFSMSGHDEGNVNVFQQWDATGRLDMRQGYFRVMYDPATAAGAGGFYTDGARALLGANDYFTRAVLGADGTSTTNAYHSHLMLTQADQVFNAPYLYAYNDNRNGTLTIGGENESGSVFYGTNDNSVNFSLQFANQTSERDVRFLQVRGGTLVWNGRLDDENSTVQSFNSSVSIVGPGTVIFNRNGAGNSDIDRWNFMGGEAHWGTMTGNDQFASNSTQALAGQSTWGGGGLVLDAQGTARSQQLNSHIWLFNGSSFINTQNNTTLILGNAAASLTRRSGSSLAFLEDDTGAIRISAGTLSTTAGDFLGAWGVYGSSLGITDWAAREGTTDVQAFAGYTDDTVGVGVHANLTGGMTLGADSNAATVRFATGANLDLGGNTLTVDEGGILIPTAVTGAVTISNGTLTSGWSSGSGDLMLHNYGTGITTISAVISDNAGKVNLVNAGSGTTVLQSNNTYTGETFLNGGVLQISSESQLGAIDGSITRLARVNVGGSNGTNLSGSPLIFTTSGVDGGATGTFNTNGTSGGQVTSLTLTSGGSGYTSGIYVTNAAAGSAGIWAMLDSGNLHFDGGTLAVTNDITLDGARTLFLGSNGGTLDVAAGKNLTINGYITSEFSHVTTANGFTNSNQIGASYQPASDRNPDIGDLIIQGGGTVLLTGAPDNTIRANMYNSYGGITWINEGTLKIAGAGSSAAGALGTNRSWVDGTIIGAAGTLEFSTTSDPTVYEWLTFRGTGYEGRGTVLTTGTARAVRLNGQMFVESDVLFNLASASYGYIRLGEGGGTLYGSGDILRTGAGNEFGFYLNAPDWTGRFLSGSGTSRVSGAGNLQGMTEMALDRNSFLLYSAGSTSIDEWRDRFNDSLALSINGYSRLRVENGSGVFSGIETLGVATVNSGVFGIEYAIGADITGGTIRLQGDYDGWHFSEIVRNPGTIVQARLFDPGMDFSTGITDLTNRALLLVDTAPIMVGTGDGLNGNTAIIPGFFGGTRPTDFLNATTGVIWDEDRTSRFLMTSVASVDPITGAAVNYLRPLSDAPGSTDYKIVSDPGTIAGSTPVDLTTSGINADQNVRFVGLTDDAIGNGLTSRINSILTLDTTLETNSVTFATDATAANINGAGNQVNLLMTQGGGLKINSGVLMFASRGTMDRLGNGSNTGVNLDINNYIIGGTIDFGGKEGIIYAGSEWAQYNVSGTNLGHYNNTDGDNTTAILRTRISNTGGNGLTKTGASSVTLEAANDYTGDTSITMGNLYARHDFAFGQSTRVNLTGAGNLVLGYNSRIMGVDLYIGATSGNNLALYAEGDGIEWGGNVIFDNVDATGSAGGITRTFVPRISAASSNTVFRIDGNLYGSSAVVLPGAQATSRIFTTLTGAGLTTLDFHGQIRDKVGGAITAGSSMNEVLRMEVAGSDTANVHLYQQHDSAGRISIVRGVLRYMGDNNFYTDAAALALDPEHELSGFQMGGRSLIDSNYGIGSADVAFFLHNAGSNFNLSSWNVGVDITDPDNSLGNSNYGFGNTTGNTSLGGENISGTITFGTGTGSIRFTQASTLYDRNLNLYAARGGTVDMRVNFLDGGDFVNSSITKVGAGTVNLLGSSAGDSTVEELRMLGGTLVMTGYDVNASRRVGNGARLVLSGGYLIVDATAGGAQEDFSDLTLNSGGSRLAVRGNAVVNINSSTSLNPESGVTMAFVENGGGVINISASGMTTTDGERFGYWAVYGGALGQITDWAAREGTTGVKAFTGYDVDTFGTGLNTSVTTSPAAFGADTATNSIQFASAANLDLGGNTLTVENGGMLVSFNAGGPVNIINGTLTRSGAGDILLHNYGTATISANITNDGANAVSLVTGGGGTTVLSGSNTYTGDTYINGGVLQISSESQLGSINGSITRLVRENSGGNSSSSAASSYSSLTDAAIVFTTAVAPTTAATGTFNANNFSATATSLTSGGSGYSTGVWVNLDDPNKTTENTAGVWGILDSGNLHLDGGTLAVTDDITLDGARTIFLGASGGTFDVAAGKTLAINGYITSDVTDVPPGDSPIELTRPYVGGLAVEGGGTLLLTGSPDNTLRQNMYNGYNSLTSINNGTLKFAGFASSGTNALGTYSGWADGTYIGPNGTLLMNITNSDGVLYEWLTLDGQGYQGGGTFQTITGNSGTTRAYYLRGQIHVLSDAVFNLRNGSNIYLNNGGGETYGSGDIVKIGTGEFRFYSNIANYTGNYTAASGTTRIYDAGRVMGMASMTLERNSFFGFNADSTGADETRSRLGDDMPVYTDGYVRMRMEATGGVFSGIEKLGTANVMNGQLGIEFDLGATLAGSAPVLKGEYVGWHFTEIVRNAGTSVQLRNLDFGTAFAGKDFNANVPSNANANLAVVQVDILPTMSGMGDGTNGDAPIAIGFFGGVRPGWINLAGTGNIFNEDYVANRLVTVDTNIAGEHFLRPLLDSEYKEVGNPDTAQTTSIKLEDQGITADQNLKIVGVTSDIGFGVGEFSTSRRNSLLTLGSVEADCALPAGINLVVNSLTFASETFADGVNGRGNWTALMLAENATLKINSGVIQVYNTGFQNRNGAAYDANQNLDIRSSINGGSVDFNGNEAQFNIGSIWAFYNTSDAANAYRATDFDNNYFYMNSSIVNATGLTKSGGASLFLQAPNYYTGTTTTSYGAIYLRHDQALGNSTRVEVTGYGTIIPSLGVRITGADLYVGKIADNRTALQLENGSVWAGNVIIDNVDSGGATSYARSFTPRIFNNYSGLGAIDGNIFGGDTVIGSGARTDSRMFSTYTGGFGLLYLTGVVQDNAAGALTGPIDIFNQSQVLRMEVTANNNESAVQIGQQYNAAGRININRGTLYYSGTGNFYTDAAAATVNSAPWNPMIGLQMGGRSVTSDSGRGAANLGFFLLNGGQNFNLMSWQVGVDINDPDNAAANYTYSEGNTTGNSTLGGVNTDGTVTFGTGEGSISFTQGTNTYTRDLGLFAASGGEVDIRVNFVDGGGLVTTSITKLGGGQVNLLGSSAGDSTVEGVNVMGGILAMAGYDTNLNRRVGNGAGLTLAGGTLVMDGSGASFTENFGSLKLNQGGNAIAAAGNGVSSFGTISLAGSSITRAAAGTIHFQSIGGGVISFSNGALQNVARIGSYATFGANAAFSAFATDWAATNASGNVIAYTGYGVDSFGASTETDVQGAGLTAATTNSVRFNAAAGTITGGALTLNDGGILITSNYTTGTVIGAGVDVTTAATGTDLIIHNFASDVVGFDGNIIGAQNVVFSGTGELAFVSSSSVNSSVVSSSTSSNSYTVAVDTTGLVAGMDVSGVGIAPGTKILSITDAANLVLTKLVTGSGTNDLTYSTTTYTPTNTYTGATHITGDSTVSFNNTGVFGSTSGFFLNGGTLNYSEVGAFSGYITQNITLGGGNGILSVTDAGSTLIFRGAATNQFSSEANNIITAYGTNNPNAGGLQIIGSGTVQFGDRSAAAATQDLLGVANNYTGLTIIGDGVNAVRVDIQGQGNDNAQYSIFGTTESWADATIVKNNATIEFSMKRGDGSRDNQIRFREWFQIGEQAGDQILFDGSTARQPTLDGILNIIGDLTFQTQGNRYGDAGSTGNSEFLINPNEGGIMGSGNIIKMGDGNLRFYTALHEWTGDLDIQDGFLGLQMNAGAIFNPTGKIYFGDPTGAQTSLARMRIENRFFGNNTLGLDSGSMDLTVNRDIIVRDNLHQQIQISAGYLPNSATVHFTNSINVGNGSNNTVDFYYEDNNNLDPTLTGHVQQTLFDISGDISGSNNVYFDANNNGTNAQGAQFTILLSGDNSGYSGRFTIGKDAGTTDNPLRGPIVRIGSATALGTNSAVGFRNYGVLQLAGNSMSFTQDFLFTGGVGSTGSGAPLSSTAGIENGSATAATITFDSGTKTGPTYQDVGVGIRDGVASILFGGGSSTLTVVKTGAGDTVFGASTGGGDVVDAFSNYTGNTLVLEGHLYAGSNNSFSPYSRFIVSAGATLSPYWDNAGTGFNVTIGSLSGAAGSFVNIDQSIFYIGGDATHDADFAGEISGLGNFYKTGGGTQTLSGVNTFSGNLAVNQGSLVGGNNDAFGDVSNTIYLGGFPFESLSPLVDAKVELLLSGTATAVANPVVMNGFDGNDEGVTVIGTRQTSGTYGFTTGATVDLYQDYSTNVFFEAAGTSVVQFGDAVREGGSAAVTSLIKIGSGTVELQVANDYGSSNFGWAAGAGIDGGTVIRGGTLSVFDDSSLSSTVVELGDTRFELTDAYVATTGSLLSKSSTGSFDAASDGAGGAGNGAFLDVAALVDGVTITAADVGKRILVKDESTHPEYNGVYEVVSVDDSCARMNLVRVSDYDESTEMLYGSSIAVTNGTTQAGLQFFQASANVDVVNNAVYDPVHWLQDVPNADVALLAANSGMTIVNDIDVNDTNGTGSTILGGTFATGSSDFTGNVTLQHIDGVDNARELVFSSASNDSGGVNFTGVISEDQAGDTLSVNKQGAGTVTFSNVNTYTGKTTVTEGTLALSGSGEVSATPWIEINTGATFDFSATGNDFTYDGTISGSGTVVTDVATSLIVGTDGGAGVLRVGMSSDPSDVGTAGDSIGVLTVNGNLVLAGDSTGADRLTLQMGATNGADYHDSNLSSHVGVDLSSYLASQAATYDAADSGNHDRLVVNGDVTLNSGGYVRFTSTPSDYQPVVGDVFDLIDWTTVTNNGFDDGSGGGFRSGGLLGDLGLPDLSLSGLLFDTSLFADYGIVVVVPEPGRMSLLLTGLTLLLFRRRRPRH
jgi:autotransporter-associated beta strand protein